MNKRQSNVRTNIFMDIIYKKTTSNFIGRLFHKIKYKRLRKTLENGSPSFIVLWNMSDFIKLAEDIFFYDNNSTIEDGLYSSRNYTSSNQNGFKLVSPECTLVVKLFKESKRVVLEVVRSVGHKTQTQLSFKNEDWEHDPSPYDEMLLEETIKLINRYILNLVDWCYNKR